jgi:hypothetical protein
MSLNHANYELGIEEMVDKYRWRFSYVYVYGSGTSPAGVLFPYYPNNKMGEAYNNAIAQALGTSYGCRIVKDWISKNNGQPFICFNQLHDCLVGISYRVEDYESDFNPKSDRLDYWCEKLLELGKQCYEALQDRDPNLEWFDKIYEINADREYEDNITIRNLRILRRDLISGKVTVDKVPRSTRRQIRDHYSEFMSRVGLNEEKYEKLKKITAEIIAEETIGPNLHLIPNGLLYKKKLMEKIIKKNDMFFNWNDAVAMKKESISEVEEEIVRKAKSDEIRKK